MRHLLDGSPAVIYTCAVGGDYAGTYVSDNVRDLLGYRPEDFLVNPSFWKECIHPDDRERVLADLAAISQAGRRTHEYRFRDHDGRYRCLRGEIRLVRDEETGAEELVGSWLDITASKAMEEGYRRFARLTSDYVHYCTRRGAEPFHVQWVDGAVNPISGYGIDDILNMGCWLPLVHAEDQPPVKSYLFDLRPGDCKSIEFRIVTRAGKVRWVQEKSRCEDGAAEGELVLYGAVTDITERKEAEEALRESDRIKSEFIATASHELRTPLAVIHGYAELLCDGDFDCERQREFLTIIREKSLALEKIIDDLLDISRIETGRILCLDIGPCNVLQELRKLVGHFQRECGDRRFHVQCPGEEYRLAVDQAKIVQVLENLLGNAVKFSPAGSDIHIHAEWFDDRLLVGVEDLGIGIAPEQQERIFDKFYRVDATDTAPPGLGIGLYLTKKIVEAHGGRIWAESDLGRGTKFFFTLLRTAQTGA